LIVTSGDRKRRTAQIVRADHARKELMCSIASRRTGSLFSIGWRVIGATVAVQPGA